jgi:DNA mismatch endonuclease (patch repair protein)
MGSWPKIEKVELTSFGGLSRSALMARICGSGNASTEVKFVALLRSAGIKGWRRNSKLPGKPDVIFPKFKLAIFIDGCFWHGHKCLGSRVPNRNTDAWIAKIRRNKKRDSRVARRLRFTGWRVMRIWECTLAKRPQSCLHRVVKSFKDSGRQQRGI